MHPVVYLYEIFAKSYRINKVVEPTEENKWSVFLFFIYISGKWIYQFGDSKNLLNIIIFWRFSAYYYINHLKIITDYKRLKAIKKIYYKIKKRMRSKNKSSTEVLIDYSKCRFECVVSKKKFLGSSKRYLYIFDNHVVLNKVSIHTPHNLSRSKKRTSPISCSSWNSPNESFGSTLTPTIRYQLWWIL